jgi:ribosomal protein S18 acetylase RimI-like enzyme
MANLPANYHLRLGITSDRSLLINFLTRTYQEFFPEQKNLSHLADTVRQFFSSDTPLWIIEFQQMAVACLWMGSAVDQVTGDRYGHIFLIYVDPKHRCQGIATALINRAKDWSKSSGQRQIGLQVFINNQNALNLYQNLGFQTRSFLMLKNI